MLIHYNIFLFFLPDQLGFLRTQTWDWAAHWNVHIPVELDNEFLIQTPQRILMAKMMMMIMGKAGQGHKL